jgi:SPP1 family predicted phage head-tail adaptor
MRNAGRLDQRVTLERLQPGEPDDYGTTVDEWVSLGTVWAAVEPLAGREYFAAGLMLSEVTTRITLRHRAGLTVEDRVTHDGRPYNITSVIDYRSQKRELVLMCRG